MHLELVHIQNLRCLKDIRFQPNRRLNWLIGDNGQGKTSLLEGLFILATGNSFRDRGENLIRLGETQLLVFGEVSNAHEQHRIGVMRDKQQRVIKIDGDYADSAWPLLEILPMLAITAENSQLLADSPQMRRRLLDWGLFHVEPRYGELLRGFRRALKQRNAWLKAQERGPNPWDRPFLDYATEIQALRSHYVEALLPDFVAMLDTLTGQPMDEASLGLASGWARQRSLAEALQQDHGRDLAAGFTHSGPHRADLRFAWKDLPASTILSRGQIKLWSHAFRLAQLRYLHAQRGLQAVVLLDDFGAELDPRAREQLLQVLLDLDLQVFATVTHKTQIPAGSPPEAAYFRLEAGEIQLIEGKAA
ncbi:MAG: DNA replication/repair protein RecF [Pseudomonadota bacterium]|uniref:DNA replication/repair protein RecF n=1 Tax=Thermithiobacillus tepidarius TaxID=929 RepID=UPI0004207AB0|nr:DNA replication/repair protein RecF [Thermithiobacillus tepidarius]